MSQQSEEQQKQQQEQQQKKVVLEGEFSYNFVGTAGSWAYHLGRDEDGRYADFDIAVTTALEAQGMITRIEEEGRTYPRFTAGRVRITIEPLEEV